VHLLTSAAAPENGSIPSFDALERNLEAVVEGANGNKN
jgi:hypothetical protein